MSRRTRVCPPDAVTAIFVEGGDEERMVRRFVPLDRVFVQCFDGREVDQIRARTLAAKNDPGWPRIQRVGVILDAEESQDRTWALVAEVFGQLGVAVPSARGIVEESGGWRVGAFVSPDNVALGASEALLLRAAPVDKVACVDALFACTPNPGANTAQKDKARAQALAATVGVRPDQLWDRQDPTNPAFAPLRAFLDARLRP